MSMMKSMISKQVDKISGGYGFLYGAVFTWDGAAGTLSSGGGKKYNFTEKTWHHDVPPVIGEKVDFTAKGDEATHVFSAEARNKIVELKAESLARCYQGILLTVTMIFFFIGIPLFLLGIFGIFQAGKLTKKLRSRYDEYLYNR